MMQPQTLSPPTSAPPLRPYVEIRPTDRRRGAVDECFLVYGERELRLTPTQYAILLQVLNNQGRDLEDASEERQAVTANGRDISPVVAKTMMLRLRAKIKDRFGDDLILPKSKTGCGSSSLALRLFTRAELEALRESLRHPDPKIEKQVIVDEHGIRHLFVRGIEIVTGLRSSSGISFELLMLADLLLTQGSINPTSRSFKTTWFELTGKDGIPTATLSTNFNQLREAFKPAGYTITKPMNGRGSRKTNSYSLVPLPPAPAA